MKFRRYLNNPEIMGGAAWFGLGLMSGSKLVYALAILKSLGHWWFLSFVEQYVIFLSVSIPISVVTNAKPRPHMRKLYGDSLRKDAGFVKVLKSNMNVKVNPKLGKKMAKVYEETVDVVEDFLAKCTSSFVLDFHFPSSYSRVVKPDLVFLKSEYFLNSPAIDLLSQGWHRKEHTTRASTISLFLR